MTRTTWQRAATVALRCGSLLVVGLVGFALAVLVVIPRATHGAALTVLTGSMTPTIPVGSVVVDRPADPGTLHVGDIATYQKTAGKAEFITHRIVAINTKTSPVTFIFKGDANRGPDVTPVPATAIRGKVWFHVPHLGTIRDSIQSRGMRSTVLVLALLGLAAYALSQMAGYLRERRSGQPGPIAADSDTHILVGVFDVQAFDGIDADIVAHLLGGASTNCGRDLVALRFTGTPSRLDALRCVLEPFAPLELVTSSLRAESSPAEAARREQAVQYA